MNKIAAFITLSVNEMILTRYLYSKTNVEYSLKIAVFQENLPEALFWAYELYFSGFDREVLQLLCDIFDNYFAPSPRKNKMAEFLQRKMEEWRTTAKDFTVATVVKNIIHCQIDTEKLAQEFPQFAWETYTRKHVQAVVYVSYKDADIQSYKNRPVISTKSWKIPRKRCLYMCLREPGSPNLTIQDYDAWVFYASASPFWKTRIQRYGGKVDDDKKTVTFTDEDSEETFYNLYNLEPDEQPLSVIHNWIGKPT